MSGLEETSSVEVSVHPAAQEQAPVLANLLELYAHDFSEFSGLEIGEDGRFGYPYLSFYWTEAHRYPFLIKVEGKLAGFVLLQKGSQVSGDTEAWDVAEFFIIRGHRRRGIGAKAAHTVWRMFPGKWEVRVMEENGQAREFWSCAVSEFAGEPIRATIVEKDGKRWHLFSFQS
jgi:predicted acetyltransferase